jgi:hypothetical protein
MQLLVDKETGELLPVNVMVKADKAPAIVIDINDVVIYHNDPDKLVSKIRDQAGFAVFDVGNEKGRAACRSHAANIIKCISPAINASKALAADAQKVVKQDIAFRKYFEESVREIAEFHRKPLTEYENEQKRIELEQKELEEKRLADEKYLADWDDAINFNELYDLRKERELANKLVAEKAEQERRAKEIAYQLEAQRIKSEQDAKDALARAEQKRLDDLAKAEKEKQLAVANEQARAKCEAEEKERAINEQIEQERLAKIAAEHKALNAPDKDKLLELCKQIELIKIPSVGVEASKTTDEVVVLLNKVCVFIKGRASKL